MIGQLRSLLGHRGLYPIDLFLERVRTFSGLAAPDILSSRGISYILKVTRFACLPVFAG